MSDSSFDEKLTMNGGFQQSALRLNQYVITQTAWSEAQVRERASQPGEIARKAWPYPHLAEEELALYRAKGDSKTEFTLESYKHLNDSNLELFERLNNRIHNLGPYVRREFNKLYIAYKADTNFVDVIVQKKRLLLTINMKFADVIDPKRICKDITSKGRLGNGDVQIALNSLDMIDDAMDIIEQAYRLQDVE